MNFAVQQLSDLELNWDSFGGKPIDENILNYIEKVIDTFDLSYFQLYPTVIGGIQLKYNNDQINLEIELLPDKNIHCYLEDVQTGEEFEWKYEYKE